MKRWLMVSVALFALGQVATAQTAQQQQQLKLLNQLDQMDKLDLLDRLDEAKACANKEDFSCSADKIKAAKLLIVDGEDTKAIADTQAYVNAKIVARDERIRREAEARAKAEAEARARAAAQSSGNGSSSSSQSWNFTLEQESQNSSETRFGLTARGNSGSRRYAQIQVFKVSNGYEVSSSPLLGRCYLDNSGSGTCNLRLSSLGSPYVNSVNEAIQVFVNGFKGDVSRMGN